MVILVRLLCLSVAAVWGVQQDTGVAAAQTTASDALPEDGAGVVPSISSMDDTGDAATDDRGSSLPMVRVIVVDFQEVVRSSDAATSVRSQIDDLRRGFQEEFSAIEEELRAVEQELVDDQTSLTAEEFTQKRREFEQRITDAQSTAQLRRAALDRALDESMAEIRTELIDVIQDIAEEKRANIVLNQSEVILMGQNLDFNMQALEGLNERLPFVSVNIVADQ